MVKAIEKENQPRFFWFFLQQWQKEQNKPEVANFGYYSIKPNQYKTTPALRATPPDWRGIFWKVMIQWFMGEQKIIIKKNTVITIWAGAAYCMLYYS